MFQAVNPTVGHTNGTVAPAPGSESRACLPPELAEWPPMIAAVMEQTRRQLNARDASAEQHTWYWHRFAMWLGGVLTVAVLVIAWLVWDRREVQAFVQVVQVEDGRLVQIGVPQRLLDYTPLEGAWHDLMTEWLRRVYWRGDDPAKAEHLDWRWAELHTCPSARPFLAGLKERLKPGKKSPTRVQVNIKTVTKTPTPSSYQVLWETVSTGPEAPKGKSALFTTTFTVGRIALKALADAADNHLGVCVASFDTREHQ